MSEDNFETPEALADAISAALLAQADDEKAPQMAAYMKTEMPFYGVQSKPRKAIERQLAPRYKPDDQQDYEDTVLALWQRPHREEKYLAIALARRHKTFIQLESLPLYEQMIRQGAWWDFVDEIASWLVGGALRADPETVFATLDDWIDDEHLWIRRSAIIAQLRSKLPQVDAERLFTYCLASCHEDDFFIRKAIGWALRNHAKKDEAATIAFLMRHGDQLSNISWREATKHLDITRT